MKKKQKLGLPANQHCLNCETELNSLFCPICGQKNKDYHLSFRDLFSDFLEELLDVDSRVLRSLRMLFTRPGFLTTEYIKGRRISYLPPVRIYLIASVLFFLLLSLKTLLPQLQNNELLKELAESNDIENTLEEAVENRLGAINPDLLGKDQIVGERGKTDTTKTNMSVSIGKDDFDLDQTDVLSSFADNFAKVMFFLLPVAAFQLKVLYIRRKKMYIEHLVFSLHVHAFIFSLLILTLLLDYKLVMWFVIIASFIYLYLAMKNYYEQSYSKTASKMVLLLFSYGITTMLVMVLTLLFTAVGILMDNSG